MRLLAVLMENFRLLLFWTGVLAKDVVPLLYEMLSGVSVSLLRDALYSQLVQPQLEVARRALVD